MGSSTLTPGNLPAGPDRRIHQGHGTSALGPSDNSDSGSDVQGVPDDVGGIELDSDTDAEGTGERGAAGADAQSHEGEDIGVDHVESFDPEEDDPEERP